jgi:hypothetical protein
MRWVALAIVALAGCGRRSEFIGRVLADAAAGSGADAGADGRETAGTAASCPADDPAPAPVPPPVWSCGERCLRDPRVDPASFRAAATDPDPQHRPAIVYPFDGSIHPPNLARLTVQWRRSSQDQDAFRVRIDPGGGQRPYELHLPYAHPVAAGGTVTDELDASFEIPPPVWRHIARQHAGSAVSLTVAALDGASNRIAESAPVSVRLSPSGIEAGLFYLATEPPASGIQRHVFGAEAAQPLVRPDSPANRFDCGGCHAVSRDGSTLAFAATYAGNLTIAPAGDPDHPTMRPPPPPDDVATGLAPAVSPDGRYIVARHGVSDTLLVYDRGGQVIGQRTAAQTGGRVDFPEFSPDGREIVATRARAASQPPDKYSAYDGQLVVLPFADGAIGEPEEIAGQPDQVYAHPSWSPDGRWVVFTAAPAGGESHANRQTRLRLVNRQDRRVVDLENANRGEAGAFFPKFAPGGQRGCQLLFIAFHSRLDYGLLRRNSSGALGGVPQLWLTAIDLSRDGDPSAPPVWLPFQDLDQQNLLPVWSATIPCAGDGECGPGAFCQAGSCRARLE